MKKKLLALIATTALFYLLGCKKDLPEPEVKANFSINSSQSIYVAASQLSKDVGQDFNVSYHLNGNNLFVECIVKNISFRDDNYNSRRGKIVVYVNGKKTTEVSNAMFVLKNLPKGENEIELQIVDLKNKQYGLSKRFKVTI